MKNSKLIITSIASPNEVLKTYAKAASTYKYDFIVIGDRKSPTDFKLDHCDFWSVKRQLEESNSQFAKQAPLGHYARKNIGYILAMRSGTEWIIETDDDNFPIEGFWEERKLNHEARVIDKGGWTNAYRYFTELNIWPRGFALDRITRTTDFTRFPTNIIHCPIQQGLADDNPDVDAIYRLILPLPFVFEKREKAIGLGSMTWCPFNSQNTSWHRSSFLLTYLPSYCSFRMTDIWRSFIAQRIAWENKWHILFHNSTVRQDRNEHSLMKDFEDEISGYVNNHKICAALEELSLKPGVENIADNMIACYSKLISMGIIGKEEAPLLESWIKDMTV